MRSIEASDGSANGRRCSGDDSDGDADNGFVWWNPKILPPHVVVVTVRTDNLTTGRGDPSARGLPVFSLLAMP